MKIKGITDECFSDYLKPSMFIAFPSCTFKCNKESKCEVCQNAKLIDEPDIDIKKELLIERFLKNPITEAIVMGGLEPFDSILDVSSFIDCLRRQYKNNSTVVIYTGYTEEEIINGTFGDNPNALKSVVESILSQGNIIIKYGRYKPDGEKHFDQILGVVLSSKNQYAKKYE